MKPDQSKLRENMTTPFPKKHTLWPIILIPVLMSISYLSVVFPRFCDEFSLVWQHFIVLILWLINTFIIMILIRDQLLRWRIKALFIPAVLVPSFSIFILYLIYICALVGYFSWDDTLNYIQVLGFIPHLFDVADNFDIPRALFIALLILPLVALILIFEGRVRDMLIWYWALKEAFEELNTNRRRLIAGFCVMTWLAIVVIVVTADPSIDKSGNFSHDPVVTFFKAKSSLFPMTRKRLDWVRKDRLEERKVKRQFPKVHNIFLFVVDAMRADHLPIYGYARPLTPFLSDFFVKNNAVKVDLGLSNGLETITGLQCLLTSKEPTNMCQFDYTLPDYLSDHGFKTRLILAGGHGWQLDHKSFGKKIDLFFDGSEHPGPRGSCDDELVVDEVANLEKDDGGYHFFYIHLISVHQLSELLEPYQQYKPYRNILNLAFTGSLDQTDIQATIIGYDDRILQMDSVMRKLLLMLKQKGYLEDYVAVFTGDHGQLLGEKGEYGHGCYAALGAIHIPMIFFGSHPLPSFPESRFGTQIDIAPTITDLAGVDFPSVWQGQSLLRPRTNPWSCHLSAVRRTSQEGAVVYYMADSILKFTRLVDTSVDDPGRLNDIQKDPEELDDLIGKTDPHFLGELRSRAREYFAEY
jgi:glucan phosphoethanolaminetransferase (alkaline phosphatase superfamily)